MAREARNDESGEMEPNRLINNSLKYFPLAKCGLVSHVLGKGTGKNDGPLKTPHQVVSHIN